MTDSTHMLAGDWRNRIEDLLCQSFPKCAKVGINTERIYFLEHGTFWRASCYVDDADGPAFRASMCGDVEKSETDALCTLFAIVRDDVCDNRLTKQKEPQ